MDATVLVAQWDQAAYYIQTHGTRYAMVVVDGAQRLLEDASLRVAVESLPAPYRLGMSSITPGHALSKSLRACGFGEVVYSAGERAPTVLRSRFKREATVLRGLA
jgi:hypothetical protein